MNNDNLDKLFIEALEIASKMTQAELPIDVQLRLYAFYKQATMDSPSTSTSDNDIRNAFKINAWMQIRHLSVDEAKESYIELIHTLNKK